MDDTGTRLLANTTSNGRFHSDWLTMMYARLKLARNLLSHDGAIFISIDGNELASLRLLCDEVFGTSNHCGIISRLTGTRMGSGPKTLASELDYVLVYSKTDDIEFVGLPMTDEEGDIYDRTDSRGRFLLRSLRRTGGENRREDRPSMYFPIRAPDGAEVYPIAPAGYESRWICSKSTYAELVKTGMIEWKQVEKDGVLRWQVYQKHYLGQGMRLPSNLWQEQDGNKKATRELNSLFDGLKVFDHPKPVGLLERIISLATMNCEEAIVLDFFAGSGSTGEALLNQNSTDRGNRTFILVQIPEPLDDSNKAQQVAAQICDQNSFPRNVAELTKERLRRSGRQAQSDAAIINPDLDTGFRVLKIDTSNMKEIQYTPDDLKQGDLLAHLDNIREDRTPEDLLFQVLVDWGVDLSLPISTEEICGKTVFFVDQTALAACFDRNVDEELVRELAKRVPMRVVFRDSGFANDSVKINVEQLFRLLSPGTEIRTL